MKTEGVDFSRLVEAALADENLAIIRPVVEKELLHYDILFALCRGGFLSELVMQGGTCLRLCHGSSRLSEDLDFAGGTGFAPESVAGMAECIENSVASRYGLKVTVRPPRSLSGQSGRAKIKVHKWQIAVQTAPARPDIASQRIKVEVANVPAHTRETLPLRGNYDFLPDGYDRFLIAAESRAEIMADKLVALPVSTTLARLRHRDIWDLAWLERRNTAVDAQLVARKLDDYGIDDWPQKSEAMAARLAEIVHGREFGLQMRRFLPADVHEQTLAKNQWLDYLAETVSALLKEAAAGLAGRPEHRAD